MDLGIVKREELNLNLRGTIDHHHSFANYTPDQTRGLLTIVAKDRDN